mgnify:CR=1 FL=1
MKLFQPKFFSIIKKYNGNKFASDLVAGVIVAIIALPLSIAFILVSNDSSDEIVNLLVLITKLKSISTFSSKPSTITPLNLKLPLT